MRKAEARVRTPASAPRALRLVVWIPDFQSGGAGSFPAGRARYVRQIADMNPLTNDVNIIQGFMSKPSERTAAIALRQQGKSIKSIAKKLSVSVGSVSLWCRNVVLTSEQKDALDRGEWESRLRNLRQMNENKKEKAIQRRVRARRDGEMQIGQTSDRDVMMLGLGLYWGEGSKRTDGLVCLVNMDADVIDFYLYWLQLLGIDRTEVRANLHIAPGFQNDREVKWWCQRLRLQPEQFNKTIVKVASTSRGKTKRDEYHGILSIRISDVDVWTRILGMIKCATKVPIV